MRPLSYEYYIELKNSVYKNLQEPLDPWICQMGTERWEPHTSVLLDFPQAELETYITEHIRDSYRTPNMEVCIPAKLLFFCAYSSQVAKLLVYHYREGKGAFQDQIELIKRVLVELDKNPEAELHEGIKCGRYKHWGLLYGYDADLFRYLFGSYIFWEREDPEMGLALLRNTCMRYYSDAHEMLVTGMSFWPAKTIGPLVIWALKYWEEHGNVSGGGTGLLQSTTQLMQIFWEQNVHVWEDPEWPQELPHTDIPEWEEEGSFCVYHVLINCRKTISHKTSCLHFFVHLRIPREYSFSTTSRGDSCYRKRNDIQVGSR